MSGPLLAAAARQLDQRRAARGLQKRFVGQALVDDLRPMFRDDTSSSGARSDGGSSSEFSDVDADARQEVLGEEQRQQLHDVSAAAHGRPSTAPADPAGTRRQTAAQGDHERATRRHRAPYEKPYDPATGARQLAHAKQRIRDLEAAVASRDAELEAIKAAMSKHAEMIDYLRETMLRDVLASIRIEETNLATTSSSSAALASQASVAVGGGSGNMSPGPAALAASPGGPSMANFGSGGGTGRRAAAYNQLITTLLDDERMMDLQNEVRQLLVVNADGRRDARIKDLEGKEAKLLQRTTRLQARLAAAQSDVQAAHRETSRAQDLVLAAQKNTQKREEELSTARLKMLDKDSELNRVEDRVRVLERDLDRANQDLEACRATLAEKQDHIDVSQQQAAATKANLVRNLEDIEDATRELAVAQDRANTAGVNAGDEWQTARGHVNTAIDKIRRGAAGIGASGELYVALGAVLTSCATGLAVESSTVKALGLKHLQQSGATAAAASSSGGGAQGSKLDGSLNGVVDACVKLESAQQPRVSVLDREADLQSALVQLVGAVGEVAHAGTQAVLRRLAQAFSKEVAAWRTAWATSTSQSNSGAASPLPSAPLALPRRSSSIALGSGGGGGGGGGAAKDDVPRSDSMADNTETVGELLDAIQAAKTAVEAKASRDRIAPVLASLRSQTLGPERHPVASMTHCGDLVVLLEKEHDLATKALSDRFETESQRVLRRAEALTARFDRALFGSALPPILGGGVSFNPAQAISASPETMPVDAALANVDEDAMARIYCDESARNTSDLAAFVRDAMRLGAGLAEVPSTASAAQVLATALRLLQAMAREAEHWTNATFAALSPGGTQGAYDFERQRVLQNNCSSGPQGTITRPALPTSTAPDVARAVPSVVFDPFAPQLKPMSSSKQRQRRKSMMVSSSSLLSGDGPGSPSPARGGDVEGSVFGSASAVPPEEIALPVLSDDAVGAIGLRLAAVRYTRRAVGLGEPGIVVERAALDQMHEMMSLSAAAPAGGIMASPRDGEGRSPALRGQRSPGSPRGSPKHNASFARRPPFDADFEASGAFARDGPDAAAGDAPSRGGGGNSGTKGGRRGTKAGASTKHHPAKDKGPKASGSGGSRRPTSASAAPTTPPAATPPLPAFKPTVIETGMQTDEPIVTAPKKTAEFAVQATLDQSHARAIMVVASSQWSDEDAASLGEPQVLTLAPPSKGEERRAAADQKEAPSSPPPPLWDDAAVQTDGDVLMASPAPVPPAEVPQQPLPSPAVDHRSTMTPQQAYYSVSVASEAIASVAAPVTVAHKLCQVPESAGDATVASVLSQSQQRSLAGSSAATAAAGPSLGGSFYEVKFNAAAGVIAPHQRQEASSASTRRPTASSSLRGAGDRPGGVPARSPPVATRQPPAAAHESLSDRVLAGAPALASPPPDRRPQSPATETAKPVAAPAKQAAATSSAPATSEVPTAAAVAHQQPANRQTAPPPGAGSERPIVVRRLEDATASAERMTSVVIELRAEAERPSTAGAAQHLSTVAVGVESLGNTDASHGAPRGPPAHPTTFAAARQHPQQQRHLDDGSAGGGGRGATHGADEVGLLNVTGTGIAGGADGVVATSPERAAAHGGALIVADAGQVHVDLSAPEEVLGRRHPAMPPTHTSSHEPHGYRGASPPPHPEQRVRRTVGGGEQDLSHVPTESPQRLARRELGSPLRAPHGAEEGASGAVVERFKTPLRDNPEERLRSAARKRLLPAGSHQATQAAATAAAGRSAAGGGPTGDTVGPSGTALTLTRRRIEVDVIHGAIAAKDPSFGHAREAPPAVRPLTPMAQPVSSYVKRATASASASAGATETSANTAQRAARVAASTGFSLSSAGGSGPASAGPTTVGGGRAASAGGARNVSRVRPAGGSSRRPASATPTPAPASGGGDAELSNAIRARGVVHVPSGGGGGAAL